MLLVVAYRQFLSDFVDNRALRVEMRDVLSYEYFQLSTFTSEPL